MAQGDKVVGCGNPHIGWIELLNSLLVVTSTGIVGIRKNVTTVDDSLITPYSECGKPPITSLEQFLREVVVFDANDKPSLSEIVGT